MRDRVKNDVSHDISKIYWARYVPLDQALRGGGMRSTECPSGEGSVLAYTDRTA